MTARVLMVVGTMSSAGKSVITAGLCRLIRRRGYRVAPFKAQNMSLNAAVTPDGGEIGRSTAVQARAAGIEPTVDMNPILLKPEPGMRSQVIVRGKVWGDLSAREYFGQTLDLWPIVVESLDRLCQEYEIVVAEGAGSPAEVNLRARDIVNMRVARHANASVILVGDIERGGVFAQLIGTLDLLPPEERTLVRGTIVNRFRGDPSLFADGVRILEERTGLPVFGVVPLVQDLGLAEEDSISLDERPRSNQTESAALRVAVLRYPFVANHDDFDGLERMPGVIVEFVDRPERLVGADLIVLPGSKATAADLGFLRERGLAAAVIAARQNGTPILGICGGFQMLGSEIRDPEHVESSAERTPGLDLLPVVTEFAPEKQTCRVSGRISAVNGLFATARGAAIDGYEIHLGRTMGIGTTATSPVFRITTRSGAVTDDDDGLVSDDGLVVGTYLHGVFENEAARRALVAELRARRGAGPLAELSEPIIDLYDRWADVLEDALDVPGLLERCGIG